MPDLDTLAYNTGAFICALFALEYGAEKFVDHTAIVAKRTGIPQNVIALLTAGAEWEELAVVVTSILRRRPCLAYGNIVGSTISNILGAFSLGLLFHPGDDDVQVFDQSSRLYSIVLLVITALFAAIAAFGSKLLGKAVGVVAITVFVTYVAAIARAISKGVVTAPELSDSDDSDDSENDEETPRATSGGRATTHSSGTSTIQQYDTFSSAPPSAIISDETSDAASHHTPSNHSVPYHVFLLFTGLLSLTLSAYVLSTSAAVLATALGLSDLLFGIVILSIATTLPEKLIAVISGVRGHTGIMVANTVGSNIFLLTLCLGILLVTTDGDWMDGCTGLIELAVMFMATSWMMLVISIGGRKLIRISGAAMLVMYVCFLVVEAVRA